VNPKSFFAELKRRNVYRVIKISVSPPVLLDVQFRIIKKP